jgi:hypothetical protein
VEVPFTALAGVQYRVWLRLAAAGNSKWNDSVYLQYDRVVNVSGKPRLRIGTTSDVLVNRQPCAGCAIAGWGWEDSAYWTGQTGMVRFAVSGTQTLRIQTREDGVRIDQIVISPARYLSKAPGAVNNDRTIVRPDGTTTTY